MAHDVDSPRMERDVDSPPPSSPPPLANLMPPQYRNTNVRSIFPTFHQSSPLRYSELFGAGRPQSLPTIWRVCRSNRGKDYCSLRQPNTVTVQVDDDTTEMERAHASTHDVEEEEETLSMPITAQSIWRFGPGRQWYDMIGLPVNADAADLATLLKSMSSTADGKIEEEEHYERPSCSAAVDPMLPFDLLDLKASIMWRSDQKMTPPAKPAWVPSQDVRTYDAYVKATRGDPRALVIAANEEQYDWEKSIIWTSAEAASRPPPVFAQRIVDLPGLCTTLDMTTERAQLEEEIFGLRDAHVRGTEGKLLLNLSNDEHYQAQSTEGRLNVSLLVHSVPAQQLHRSFFPLSWSQMRLRNFHRPQLRRYGRGPLAHSAADHPVQSNYRLLGSQEGGEDVIRLCSTMTAVDAQMILCEYSEQHPTLLQQPGMACTIKNYYRRKTGETAPTQTYGETVYSTSQQPYLAPLRAGAMQPTLQCNLFRAPIYAQPVDERDFLVIRVRQGYYIRPMPSMFVVGQVCPLVDVPSPHSKLAMRIAKDHCSVSVLRLFHESQRSPKRVTMPQLRKLFPHDSDAARRKRMKPYADNRRGEGGVEEWLMRDNVRLPSLDEMAQTVTPESVTAYFSMGAATQRLKELNYSSKHMADDLDEDSALLDDEVRSAVWNTSKAYMQAARGKCVLDTTGVADPTGDLLSALSHVRVSTKAARGAASKSDTVVKASPGNAPKKLVTGTSADLRKLPLKDAKRMLREFNVPESEIETLSRWEIIDVIRTLSTQQASGNDAATFSRFARGNAKSNQSEVAVKFRQYCNMQFAKQKARLTNEEAASTDDDSEGETETAPQSRALVIRRCYKVDGVLHTKTIPIDDGAVAEAYVKARAAHEGAALEQFARVKEHQLPPPLPVTPIVTSSPVAAKPARLIFRDPLKHAKNRIASNLKKSALKIRLPKPSIKMCFKRPPAPVHRRPSTASVEGSVDDVDYMGGRSQSAHRRNVDPLVAVSSILENVCDALRAQPYAIHFSAPVSARDVSDYYNIVKNPMDLRTIRANIVSGVYATRGAFIGDIKLIFDNSRLYNGDTSPITRCAQQLLEEATKLLMAKEHKLMRLEKEINPLLDDDDDKAFNFILGKVVDECTVIKGSFPFHAPVDPRKVPNYADRIARPMDLGTMRGRCAERFYDTIDTFVADARLIHANCLQFNGAISKYTAIAQQVVDKALHAVQSNRAQLEHLERLLSGEIPSAATSTDDMRQDEGEEGGQEPTDETPEPMVEAVEEGDEEEGVNESMSSRLELGGQLAQDLQLSDSDEDVGAAKRPRLDQFDDDNAL